MFSMIKSVELRNWKTHKSSTIEFRKGVNVILGVMGAGKSSVLDAISYALFGSFPDLSSKRVSLSNLITSRPIGETNAEVILKLELDGSEYTVSRRISANSSSMATLMKDGKHLQTQPERVTESIQELLKVDYDTFSRAIYSQQNRLDYFLELTKAERKKGIDGMLGLDAFAVAEDNSTSLINQTRSAIKSDEEALASVKVGELKSQMEALLKESRELEAQHAELGRRETELKAQHLDMGRDLNEKKAAYSKKKRLDADIADIRSRIETLKKESRKIEELKIDASVRERHRSAKAGVQPLKKEADALAEAAKRTQGELSKERARLDLINADIAARERLEKDADATLLKGLQERIDASSRRAQELKASSLSADSQVREMEKWLIELRQHIGKCPLCEQDLGDEARKRLISQREQLIAALKAGVGSYAKDAKAEEEKAGAATAELNLLKGKLELIKRYAGLDADKADAVKAIEEGKVAYENADARARGKMEEYLKVSESIKDMEAALEKLDRKGAYDKEVSDCAASLGQKEQESSSLQVDEKAIYALQDGFTKVSAQLSDVSSKIEGNRKYASAMASQIREKRTMLDNFERMESRISSKRAMLANMNKFKAALIETEAQLRNRLVDSINSIMQSVWPELYPYGDYANIRLEAGKDDYSLQANLVVNGNDSWQSVDAIASGGERSVACLAMRIALSMVIVPNLRWIILDEPTHNIDSNGIDKLVQVLGGTLPSVVDQVFVITHDEALKQIANAAVYQFDRDKGAHGYTSISVM